MESSNENSPNQESVLSSSEGKNSTNNLPIPPIQEANADRGELGSFGQLFEKSWNIFKIGVWKFVGISIVPPLLALIPLVIIGFVAAFLLISQKGSPMVWPIIILLGFLGLISLIVVSMISKAGTYLLFKNIDKNPLVKETFFLAKKDAWSFFEISCIAAVFTLLWSFLFIIPGIIAAIRYSFAPWAYFFEGLKGSAAIERSKQLVAGNFGWVFMNYLFLFAGTMVLSFIGSKLGSAISFIVQMASAFIGIFIFIFSGFMYFDLVKKNRK